MEIAELKHNLEFTEEVLGRKSQGLGKNGEKLRNEVNEIYDYIKNKLIELRDRSRCINVRFDGVPEVNEETWDK